jgi:hypothetical protein
LVQTALQRLVLLKSLYGGWVKSEAALQLEQMLKTQECPISRVFCKKWGPTTSSGRRLGYSSQTLHRNPVKRGLVSEPQQRRWSSYRAYACEESGMVRVNEWQVLRMKVRSA